MTMAPALETKVSPAFPFRMHKVQILGNEMAYVDTGPSSVHDQTPTALFLHGNGSSSYLWRNIIPHLAPLMRCVAPDLIGMGFSAKVANMPYRFTDHYTFLSTFINTIVPTGPVILVVHDWGSALGLHWAYQQSEGAYPVPSRSVIGLALMEFVRPFSTWEEFSPGPEITKAFQAFRNKDTGRKLIIDDNVLQGPMTAHGQFRTLTTIEIEYNQRPFLEPASREPLLVWTNQIPIEQRPSDVHDIVTRYHDWLFETPIPKLMFWGRPGTIVRPEKAQWYLETLPNVKGVDLGEIRHYPQEDHPEAIGQSLASWAKQILGSDQQ